MSIVKVSGWCSFLRGVQSPELVELERLARVEARNEMCRARMSIGSYMVKFPYARNRSAKPQYRFVQYDAKRERIRVRVL